MASPGTIRFVEISTTPAAPPVGSALVYVKTDNVVYLQDSNGIEIPLGTASGITQIAGEASGIGPGVASITLANSAVIGKVLTGFVAGPNSPVAAADTILEAFQKIQGQLNASPAISSLTGDVSAIGPGSAAATVNSVGGKTSASIATSVNDTQAATSSNTASTIVKRDASGNLSANVITASLSGNATTSTNATNFTGSLSGDVTGTQSSTSVAQVGGKTSSQIATSVDDTQAATNSNTASTIVKRDASGNFSANTITANLSGNATTATSSTSFTGSLSGDVTGTQSSTVVSAVGGKTSSAISSAVDDVQAATSTNTASTIVERDASGNFSANIITANLTGTASGNELPIVAASAADYYRGDKTFQPLNKAAVGLPNVDNTSDVNKPVSTAQAAADAAVQAYSIQRANHTGTQLASTISDFTESAQDATGAALQDTNSVDLSYNDAGNAITADVKISAAAASVGNLKSTTTIKVDGVHVENPIASSSQTGVISDTDWNTFNNKQPAGNYVTSLTGDVTASGPGASVSTVALVGGKTAAAVATSVDDTQSATNLNITSTIVKRNASGNFSAGVITADLVGNVTGNVNGVDPAAHGSRHNPGGADAISTAAPVTSLSATTSNSEGTATSVARSDHSHDIITAAASTQLPDQSNAEGSSANIARADHTHNIPSGTPVQLGTSNFAGAAASFALSDHVHSHGNQTSGSLHAAATVSVNGFMSSTDKTKLDASTNLNTASTIVQRDASGNFSAGTITANISGNATNFTGSLVGDVTGTQGATVVSQVGGKTASEVSTSVNDTQAATSTNTVSTIVKRDASGNFSAGTITANLTGSVTGAASANLLKAGDTMTGFFRSAVVALTDAPTIATDVSLGNIFSVTLGANRTLGAPTNMGTSRQRVTWIISQDVTGGRVLTFNAAFNFGIDFTGLQLSTSANATDYIGAIYNPVTGKWDVVAIVRGY